MKKRLSAIAFAGLAATGALAAAAVPATAKNKAVEILPNGAVDVKHAGVHVLPAPAPAPATNGGKTKI